LSILLGLPYGIRDDQFPARLTSKSDQAGTVAQLFAIRLGMITGRVIDQTQAQTPQPFSRIVDIDDELEALAASQAPRWWDCSIPAETDSTAVVEFRERLLNHSLYFLVRIYLHLPYLLKPRHSHLYRHSRLTGVDSARELVRRYQVLRSQINGDPIFDCKTVDFIGFMASVVLLVGTFCSPDVLASSEDRTLLKTTLSILQTLATENHCNVASQCHKTLTVLLALYDRDGNTQPPVSSQIFIPYFGILHVSFEERSDVSALPPLSPSRPTAHMASGSGLLANSENGARIDNSTGAEIPTITYDGLYGLESDMDWTNDEFGIYSDPLGSMIDLDQDWELFLNSGTDEH